jgi:hypothetical protein
VVVGVEPILVAGVVLVVCFKPLVLQLLRVLLLQLP